MCIAVRKYEKVPGTEVNVIFPDVTLDSALPGTHQVKQAAAIAGSRLVPATATLNLRDHIDTKRRLAQQRLQCSNVCGDRCVVGNDLHPVREHRLPFR